MGQEEAKAVLELEFEDAVNALAPLFYFTQSSFRHRGKPRAIIDPTANNDQFLNEYDSGLNATIMSPAGITKYILGRDAGRCMYAMVNPEIYQRARDHGKMLTFLLEGIDEFDSLSLEQHTRLLNKVIAHSQLELAIAHYCGIAYSESSRYEPPNAAGVRTAAAFMSTQTEGVDLHKELLLASAQGMEIAERLHNDYAPEAFRPIPRLSFQEATQRIRVLTDIDILHSG